MTLTKLSGVAFAFSLGLLLFAVQSGAADRKPPREAALALRGASPQSAPGATAMEQFLQCRVGCGPQCEGAGTADQTEHCKQRCEMDCNAPDGE